MTIKWYPDVKKVCYMKQKSEKQQAIEAHRQQTSRKQQIHFMNASAKTAIELNLDQNRVKTIASSIAKCPRLKVLRLELNQLTLEAFPEEILTNSQVSSLSVSGNLFQMRDLYTLPSYAQVSYLSNRNAES
ncbi:hypothetical protein FGIG_11613 [Fasciola gigantica]|uniref:Uncharacterized protein n=1 Tax=Fasciola gigantica TaxID=46835 RepID=A0A504YVM5_FASGI|nr:hypothetical protein FGIG_11613 [Fasciola gigantica]